MYFLLAWFHAIIQERLRYAPLGWSKKYEFGESDLRSACDTVDTWLDDTAKASRLCHTKDVSALRGKSYSDTSHVMWENSGSEPRSASILAART